KRITNVILYVVLIAATVFFGYQFRASFHRTEQVRATDSSTNQAVTVGEPASDASSRQVGRMMTYAILGLLSLFGLGILVARDASHLVAHRVERFIFDEGL